MRNPFAHLNPAQRKRAIIGLAGGAVVLTLLLRKRASGAATGASSPTNPAAPYYDPTTGQWIDPATGQPIGGAGISNGVPSYLSNGSLGASDVGAVTPTTPDVSAFSDALSALQSQVDALSTGPAADPVPTIPETPAPAPAAKVSSSATAKGFWWGGQFVTSLAQLKSFEQKHGNSGFNPSVWAAQHPNAAASIGLAVPSKAPASPTAHTPGPGQAVPHSSVVYTSPNVPAPAKPKPTPVFAVQGLTPAAKVALAEHRAPPGGF